MLGVNTLDHETYDKKLLQLRTQAVNDVVRRASIDGLRRLTERSPVPQHLGWVAGAVLKDDLMADLLTWLDSKEPKLRNLAAAGRNAS